MTSTNNLDSFKPNSNLHIGLDENFFSLVDFQKKFQSSLKKINSGAKNSESFILVSSFMDLFLINSKSLKEIVEIANPSKIGGLHSWVNGIYLNNENVFTILDMNKIFYKNFSYNDKKHNSTTTLLNNPVNDTNLGLVWQEVHAVIDIENFESQFSQNKKLIVSDADFSLINFLINKILKHQNLPTTARTALITKNFSDQFFKNLPIVNSPISQPSDEAINILNINFFDPDIFFKNFFQNKDVWEKSK